MRRDTEPGEGEPRDAERRRGAASRVAGHLHDRLRDAGMDAHADALADHVPAWEPAAPEEPTLAVVDHLETALGASAPVVPADVLRALGVLARDAPWRQTASYVACPPSDEFLDVYAHTTLLGPPDDERAGAARDGVALGLVLLGPGAVYPPHRHPADEIYLPLRSIEWTHERHGVPAVVAAGDLIHHLPWQPHSMRVGAGPALLLYLWSGDVTTPSRFCP